MQVQRRYTGDVGRAEARSACPPAPFARGSLHRHEVWMYLLRDAIVQGQVTSDTAVLRRAVVDRAGELP
ncbi:hypothetical protein [Streptomyces sp. Ru62]|uniref:hypothetical protein n=1 Tax=Streptomyces sp. Ru62 TaxID=2080745 RepID=UPI0011B0B0C4|nr:hypothetical protein [Streptomyces sp. Ru62]